MAENEKSIQLQFYGTWYYPLDHIVNNNVKFQCNNYSTYNNIEYDNMIWIHYISKVNDQVMNRNKSYSSIRLIK